MTAYPANSLPLKIALLTALSVAVSGSLFAVITLDETWTLSVAGQTIQVNPDGSFIIPNISAPDEFGPDGPGTRPDFLSDDFVRVTGYSTVDGVTRYVFSDPFRIRQGETYVIDELIFTLTPPPFPESIRVTTDVPTLTEIGGSTNARVTGTLIDGSLIDLTEQTAWTTYHTSNPDIATIDENGLIIAVDAGRVFITATNEGATSVTQLDVSPGDPLTTVTGIVIDNQGLPVAGINISLIGLGGSATTAANGTFSIAGVATTNPISGVIARGTDGEAVFGMASQLETVVGGFTDAGLITVTSCSELGIDCVDGDNDCLPDIIENAIGTNPAIPDTDNDGIPDGDEDSDGDGLTNCAEVIQGTDPGKGDTDDDGLSDSDELFVHGTSPLMKDTDGDTILDGLEVSLGTNPIDADSDNDTWNDESEITAGSDPLDINSRPFLMINSTPGRAVSLSGFDNDNSTLSLFQVSFPIVRIGLSGAEDDDVAPIGMTLAKPEVRVGLTGSETGSDAELGPTLAQPPVRVDLP